MLNKYIYHQTHYSSTNAHVEFIKTYNYKTIKVLISLMHCITMKIIFITSYLLHVVFVTPSSG